MATEAEGAPKVHSYDSPVLDIISNRLHYRNLKVQKKDGFKLGLAVEGGGMRGVLSAGMLLALKDLNMLDIFDVYVGTSAGSLNLSYILAEQGVMGLSVYFDDMTDSANLNPRRLFNDDHAMMDIRNMYLEAEKRKKLNVDRLAAQHSEDLFIGVLNVDTSEGELITPKEGKDRFFEYLIAGATLPYIAGKPWKIRNHDYYDGGLYYIGPSQAAEQLGCTHVLVLHTQPWDFVLEPWGKLTERIFKRLDEDYNGTGTDYLNRTKEYCEVFANLPYGETSLNNIYMYRHAAKDPIEVKRLTTDKEVLMEGARQGYQSILDLFSPHAQAGLVPKIM